MAQITQIGPVGQITHSGQVGPVGTVGQVGPVGTVGQVGPVGPVGQVGPVGPVGQLGHSGSLGQLQSVLQRKRRGCLLEAKRICLPENWFGFIRILSFFRRDRGWVPRLPIL